jgi:acetyl-CoA acetyltransferase
VAQDEAASGVVIPPDPALSRAVGIVGIGHTDYGADYAALRSGDPDHVPPDDDSLSLAAFEAALADSGLDRADVDGLSLSHMYGTTDLEATAAQLGIEPTYAVASGGLMAGLIPAAVVALAEGRCDTLAMVYSAASRSIGRVFGGATHSNMGRHSYSYYHPWGWSSQAAHWALMFDHYEREYGATEADLAHVAITVREHASRNPSAIMRAPMTVEDYLASRYIVAPMHLFDMCLVNDGGVCVILRRADMTSDLPHTPALVAGWGADRIHDSKMHFMVRERLRPQLQAAAAQTFDMAGLGLDDVGHFQAYDPSTIHLVNQLEGTGFAAPGEGLEFAKAGEMRLGGSLPTNTSGGLLSEAYMHGWNHVVEAVRQLRHEAGDGQVDDVHASYFSLATTDEAFPLLLTRPGA